MMSNEETIPTPASKNVRSFGYSPSRSVFIVEFGNGAKWEYDKVPPHVFEEAKQAPSIGSFIHARIKGYFEARKVC